MKDVNNLKIKIRKLDYLYESTPPAIGGLLAIALLMYFSVREIVNVEILNIWIILIFCIITIRFIFYKLYDKTKINEHNIEKHITKIYILVSISSFLWGFVSIYLFPQDIGHQVLILLLLGGLATGSLLSLATEYNLFLSYLLITMLPAIYAFYTQDTQLTNFITIAGIFFIIFLSSVGKKNII